MANRLICALWMGLLYAAVGGAEGRCESSSVEIETFIAAMDLGQRLSAELDASGTNVALVARMGTDLSKHGLRYSHLGIAHRDADRGWRIVHLLSDCGTSTSTLHEDGLGRFFLDDVIAFEAMVIGLDEDLGESIIAMIHDGGAAMLHEPDYNVISNPERLDYQNCNQLVLFQLDNYGSGELSSFRARRGSHGKGLCPFQEPQRSHGR